MGDEMPITGKGGKRPGAGRPKGKKNIVGLKKKILEYTSPQELKNLVERAKKMAKTDRVVLMWYLEQVFGKAKAVGEKPGGTVNNIALFLDSLEKNKNGSINRPIPINGDSTSTGIADSGFKVIEQGVENQAFISDNRQEG